MRWNRIRVDNFPRDRHRDVVYFNGKFYAVDWQGQELVCDVTASKAQRVAQIPNAMDIYHMGEEYYILESLGSLLVVVRHGGLCFSRIPLNEYEVHDDDEVPKFIEQLSFRTSCF